MGALCETTVLEKALMLRDKLLQVLGCYISPILSEANLIEYSPCSTLDSAALSSLIHHGLQHSELKYTWSLLYLGC